MKTLTFISKRHGAKTVKLSDSDFTRVKESGKWSVVCKRSRYYFQKRIDYDPVSRGRIVELHRWLLGEPRGKYVDHINGNTLDNRRENLRAVSNAANIRNGKLRTTNTSGHTGVRQPRGNGTKWEARIRVNYKIYVLGTFETKAEAVAARKEAEIRYFSV